MADMTREQAARVEAITDPIYWLESLLEHSLTDHDSIEAKSVMKAIACLRSPGASPDVDGKAGGWVRTSERMPTEADGDTNMVLVGWIVPPFGGNESFYAYELSSKHAVCSNPTHHPLWMPLPALPEVEHD